MFRTGSDTRWVAAWHRRHPGSCSMSIPLSRSGRPAALRRGARICPAVWTCVTGGSARDLPPISRPINIRFVPCAVHAGAEIESPGGCSSGFLGTARMGDWEPCQQDVRCPAQQSPQSLALGSLGPNDLQMYEKRQQRNPSYCMITSSANPLTATVSLI